ncbi:hypothetical protein WMF38_49565 [Sorangium sp. So ce118]
MPISGLFSGEVVEVHFVVAWTDGYSDESPWFAVDQDHDGVVQSAAGTGDRTEPGGRVKEDIKEFMGVGKHDFWYYPGLAMAIASFWISNVPAVLLLLAASTLFLGVFLVKSTPRYLRSSELKGVTRAFGLVGNVALVLLQIGIVGVRCARLPA